MLEPQPPPRPPKARAEAIRRLIRTLLTKLGEEKDEEVLASLAADLQLLSARVGPSDSGELMAEAEQQLQDVDYEQAEANLDKRVLVTRSKLPARRQTFESSDPKGNTYLEALDRLRVVLAEVQPEENFGDVVEQLADHAAIIASAGLQMDTVQGQ